MPKETFGGSSANTMGNWGESILAAIMALGSPLRYTCTPMGKHKKDKKKKSKQIQDALPEDVLDAAVLSIKKFRKITNEISKLSLGQKMVGGLVLAAAGLIYLDQRKGDDGAGSRSTPKFDWPKLPEALTSVTEAKDEEEPPIRAATAPRKSRKSPKTGKGHGQAARKSSTDSDLDIG
jgi:hypothetical protein